MRDQWPRFRPEVELDQATLTRLLARALPNAEVIGQAAVSGGRANTNIRVMLSGRPEALLLRVYQRDPAQAAKEMRLDALLRAAGVPTAQFLELIALDEPTGLTCAWLEWIEGERLDLSVPGRADAALGREVGQVLARVHDIEPGPAGFLSADSRPRSAITFSPAAMHDYVRHCVIEGPGAERLGPDLTGRLMQFLDREAGRAAEWVSPPVLVHGDCNPSNFIVCDGRVAALLDWEFAFSGTPVFDFGNLLRPPVGRSASFSKGLAQGYEDAGGRLPDQWRALAWLADLYAWADFLGRQIVAREVVADARAMVAMTLDYFTPREAGEG